MDNPKPGKKVGSAAIILNEAGHILLVNHNYGRLNWELPGGYVEPNECPADAVVREVLEETGLAVVAVQIRGVYFDEAEDFLHFTFDCQVAQPTLSVPGDEEISACQYWPPENLPRPISDFTVLRIADGVSTKPQRLPTRISGRKWLD